MDRDEFEARLAELVTEANDDGVQLVGAYDVRSPHSDVQDYTVEISEVRKRLPEGLWNE